MDIAEQWTEGYDHLLWARWRKETEGAGLGGMNFFGIYEAANANSHGCL